MFLMKNKIKSIRS